MFALFYTFLYINDVKKRIHILAKPQRSSLRVNFVCERAIFGVFNTFTVKKVNFFTINVKFKVILSSKSVGGGIFVQAISPTQKSGGGGNTPPPPGFTPVSILICLSMIHLGNITRVIGQLNYLLLPRPSWGRYLFVFMYWDQIRANVYSIPKEL